MTRWLCRQFALKACTYSNFIVRFSFWKKWRQRQNLFSFPAIQINWITNWFSWMPLCFNISSLPFQYESDLWLFRLFFIFRWFCNTFSQCLLQWKLIIKFERRIPRPNVFFPFIFSRIIFFYFTCTKL